MLRNVRIQYDMCPIRSVFWLEGCSSGWPLNGTRRAPSEGKFRELQKNSRVSERMKFSIRTRVLIRMFYPKCVPSLSDSELLSFGERLHEHVVVRLSCLQKNGSKNSWRVIRSDHRALRKSTGEVTSHSVNSLSGVI